MGPKNKHLRICNEGPELDYLEPLFPSPLQPRLCFLLGGFLSTPSPPPPHCRLLQLLLMVNRLGASVCFSLDVSLVHVTTISVQAAEDRNNDKSPAGFTSEEADHLDLQQHTRTENPGGRR